MSAISRTILMASDPKHRPGVLQALECSHAGWHEWEWCKRQFPKLIAERQRLIEAGELTPSPLSGRGAFADR
jgi:hypothetical protein